MRIGGQHYRTIWLDETRDHVVQTIDQRQLPHQFVIEDLTCLDDAIRAIADMHVRGAPLIGATAAWGLYLAAREEGATLSTLEGEARRLVEARPTAVNLRWAVDRVMAALRQVPDDLPGCARREAEAIADEDVEICRQIGVYGHELLKEMARHKEGPVNVLTHCNAGWLATVDWGTATSPIYQAWDAGLDIHVWVDETRPRNQGAGLTAFELAEHGVPHTVIVDNAGGHLMQQGLVDLVIVGTDRTARNGDVANKIGTYLKALAAKDNGVPFYVALPSPTIDWTLEEGHLIPIEERAGEEVTHISGATESGETVTVRLTPEKSPAANPAFDVTPARLVSGLITERGICEASEEGLRRIFPGAGG